MRDTATPSSSSEMNTAAAAPHCMSVLVLLHPPSNSVSQAAAAVLARCLPQRSTDGQTHCLHSYCHYRDLSVPLDPKHESDDGCARHVDNFQMPYYAKW